MVKYGVSRLHSILVHADNFQFIEDLLAQCAMTEPSCLKHVWSLLNKFRSEGYSPKKTLWNQVLNTVVVQQTPLNHSSVSSWAIWIMKELQIKMSIAAQKEVNKSTDCTTGLMGLWLGEKGLADINRLTDLKFQFSSYNNLMGPNWLLCYEANRQGWFGNAGAARIQNEPAFAMLASKDVSFLNRSAVTLPNLSPAFLGVGGGSGDD